MNDRISELKQEYFKVSQAKRLMLLCLALAVFLVIFWSLNIGPSKVNLKTVFDVIIDLFEPNDALTNGERVIVLRVRLPRICASILAGILLACSGLLMQGVFQNPLVSPFILGVSAGASFGAALGLVLSLPYMGVQAMAFVFGMLAVAITYFLARIYKTTPVLMLVLSGTVVSAFFQALLSIIKFTAEGDEKLPAITFWLMGSLGSVSLGDLAISLIPIVICCTGLMILRWRINLLSMGEREAKSLGVNVQRTNLLIIIFSTVITSTAVSICGIIGWVGQVIPHFCRMVVGPDHKVLIPATMFVGATYILLVDNLCRLLTASEIPLGILTAIIGAPVFAYLLRRTKGGWN